MRTRIEVLERAHARALEVASGCDWTLGEPELDRRLGPGGLAVGGVHEIRPALPLPGRTAAGDTAAALAFALGLAARRLNAQAPASARAAVLCCFTPEARLDTGQLYGAGMAAAGLDAGRVVLLQPANATDALWAIEEGLRSRSLALVLAMAGDIALTPARRLSLAAAQHATPCLLIAQARAGGAAAVSTRWRVGAAASAPHPFNSSAPGNPAFNVVIERAPGRPAGEMTAPVRVEWSDETLRFRLASGLSDAASGAGLANGAPRRRAAGAG